jgi:hypothetical protein
MKGMPSKCYLSLFVVVLVTTALQAQGATIQFFDSRSAFLNQIDQDGDIDFEESATTVPSSISGGAAGVAYYDSLTIEGVTFSRTGGNSNKPGVTRLSNWSNWCRS